MSTTIYISAGTGKTSTDDINCTALKNQHLIAKCLFQCELRDDIDWGPTISSGFCMSSAIKWRGRMQDLWSALKLCLVFESEIDTNVVDTNWVDTVPVLNLVTDYKHIINFRNHTHNYCTMFSVDNTSNDVFYHRSWISLLNSAAFCSRLGSSTSSSPSS